MVTAIITARMKANRLPNKVMCEIKGQPILGWIIDRLRQCKNNISIRVATTVAQEDQVIIGYCYRRRIPAYIGPREDVLRRIKEAIPSVSDKILRITCDLPFLSYEGIDALIDNLTPQDDYLNNIDSSKTWLDGTNAEIMWADAVSRADRMAPHDDKIREHGFMWPRQHPELFRCRTIDCPIDASDLRHIPLMVDTWEDLQRIRYIADRMPSTDDSYETLLYVMRKYQPEIEEMWRRS